MSFLLYGGLCKDVMMSDLEILRILLFHVSLVYSCVIVIVITMVGSMLQIVILLSSEGVLVL